MSQNRTFLYEYESFSLPFAFPLTRTNTVQHRTNTVQTRKNSHFCTVPRATPHQYSAEPFSTNFTPHQYSATHCSTWNNTSCKTWHDYCTERFCTLCYNITIHWYAIPCLYRVYTVSIPCLYRVYTVSIQCLYSVYTVLHVSIQCYTCLYSAKMRVVAR